MINVDASSTILAQMINNFVILVTEFESSKQSCADYSGRERRR